MKQHAPATERNRQPILEVLRDVLPATGTVLEMASGTGEHAIFFAGQLPGISWQPSDLDPGALESIDAWRIESGLANVRPPIRLDAREESWPVEAADAIVCINMIHIAPWEACEGLMRGAARILKPGAPLVLYGPYFVEERETAPSNLAFDASLRARNPAWGLRWLGKVTEEAEANGFERARVVDMPSNNLTVVFVRT